MMKRLLCLALVAALTLSLVALTPSANAETYEQSDNTVSMAGNVAVDVTNSYLNVRSGPGTNYAVVGQLHVGDKIVITETKQVGNLLWGKCEIGWISLKYTNYDTAVKEQKARTSP